MALTPIDVQQKTFATALRGYDLDEVDDFLDSVVVALKDYDQRLTDAQERISTLQAELSDRGDAEGAIARALVAAQRSADGILADAREEADRIVADANNEATELAGDRDREQQKLRDEIAAIRAKIVAVRSSVADLAATIPTTLDEMDAALEDHEEPSAGATFDAAQPVGGYEIASDEEDLEVEEDLDVAADDVPDRLTTSRHLADASEIGGVEYVDLDEADADGHSALEEDRPSVPASAFSVEELSDQIDDAFDDIVSEGGDSAESAHRPWEDG